MVLGFIAGSHVCAQIHPEESFRGETQEPGSDDFPELVWSDEFDGEGSIDTEKWFHQTLLPNSGSWFNGEIQHYTDRVENTFLDSGYLHIMARKETYTDQGVTKEYTSARLNSKFAFTYGKVVVRAQLPEGTGTWPAIWMLGKDITEAGAYWYIQGYGTTPWPACGEIDIMEHWGSNPNYVSSATHTPSSYGATVNVGGQTVSDVSSEFHIYELEWTPEKLVFSVDDVVHFTYNPSTKNADTWPFDDAMYLLLNVAILPSISAGFTESPMVIDYVRVYQESVSSKDLHARAAHDPFCYPNPFSGEVTMDLGAFAGKDLNMKLYNNQGSLVREYALRDTGNTHRMDELKGLPPGFYIIAGDAGDRQFRCQLVKK